MSTTRELTIRPRLLRRLADEPPRTVVISAPCGYGKSVLLGQWADSDPRPFVRLPLGQAHNDPSFLAASIFAALGGEENWSREVAGEPGGCEADALERFLTNLGVRRCPFVLALDDLENVRNEEPARIIERLAWKMPPGSQLALVSRADPPIRLGRLRANRALTEIRRADLTMTKGECAEALARMGVQLSARRLDMAVQRTEGWPAAVYLLGLAMQSDTEGGRALASFSGANPLVADYLREEVLTGVQAGQMDFLRRASPLERRCGSLCDAALDRLRSEETIRTLAATNLVRSLDHRGEWFELHPLVRELLRAELRRDEAADERSIHSRASEWWDRQGFPDLAIRHAGEAGDARRAGAIFWRMAPDYIVAGEAPAMLRWLKRIDAPALAGNAGLSLAKGWCRFATGAGPEAQHWAAVTRDLLDVGEGSGDEMDLMTGLALLDAALARHGIGEMIEAVTAVEAHLADGSLWQSVRCLLLGVGAQLQGNTDSARDVLEEGAHRSGFNAPLLEALCRTQLALVELDRDDAAAARAEAEKARARVDHGVLSESPLAAIVFAVSACTLAANGVFDRAGIELRSAESLFGALDDHAGWYEVEARVLLARAQAALGHRRKANEHLAAAAAQAARIPDGPVLARWTEAASQFIAGLGPPLANVLTPAEHRVLQLLPTHLSIPEIGASLCVSPNTVKTHTRNIYAKFGVSSRHAAVARAEQGGLIGPPGVAPALA